MGHEEDRPTQQFKASHQQRVKTKAEAKTDLLARGLIWSLTQNIDCWDNLYKGNIEASVALLKGLVQKLKDPSHKLLPSDTLTFTQTIKSFRLKNKKANGYLCKMISRRLSCGSSSLKSTCITAMVLVIAGAGVTLVLSQSVLGFFN
ncbi:hypothetical protein V5N11_010899 [Cardamine amara subsp. amara]|uniref:Uncharacterized protein n=1 Tax=Cardamine amara subsp. amara TaxID=228776 RepID=A0ABD1C1H8_CARAN